MIFRKTAALALLCLFVHTAASGQADPTFALALFRSGRFEAAGVEFDRFVYLNPDHRFAGTARFYAAMAEAHAGKYREALTRLMELEGLLEKSGRDVDLRRAALFQAAHVNFKAGNSGDFEIARERFLAEYPEPGPALAGYLDSMRLALLIEGFDWMGGLDFLQNARIDEGLAGELRRMLAGAAEMRPRKPVLAGALSVVPGLGHVYAGRTADGVRSFIINGALAGCAVLSVVLGIPLLAALFIVVEAVAYGANIYGGVNAAHQYNARTALDARDRMLGLIPYPPLDFIAREVPVFP